jgi:hypothetical protein
MLNVNITFIVLMYFICQFTDWIFQDDYEAINKSKWSKTDKNLTSFLALLSHSSIYAFIPTCFWMIVTKETKDLLIIFFTLFISHILIDNRIIVKWIMKYIKGMSNEQINDYSKFGFLHIGIDQRLHEIVIVILGFFIVNN